MKKKTIGLRPWIQETMWVQRTYSGIIVGVREKPPASGDIIPTVPRERKQSTDEQSSGEG